MRKSLLSLLLLTAPAANAAPSIVELQTNLGTIAIRLNYAKAPTTANNFIAYANSGFYKDTVFHRVTKGSIFVVQGGSMSVVDGKFKAPLFPPIVNEAANGSSNLAYTISMARTSDPNSATSQFFINLENNTGLDYSPTNSGYAVFGNVVTARSKAVVNKFKNIASYGELPLLLLTTPFTSSPNLITIDEVYTSEILNSAESITRVSLKGFGSVVSTPTGINCVATATSSNSPCVLSQPANSAIKVQLVATAASGYYFSGWRGDCSGFKRTIYLATLHGNHNCTAVFSKLGAVTQ